MSSGLTRFRLASRSSRGRRTGNVAFAVAQPVLLPASLYFGFATRAS